MLKIIRKGEGMRRKRRSGSDNRIRVWMHSSDPGSPGIQAGRHYHVNPLNPGQGVVRLYDDKKAHIAVGTVSVNCIQVRD